MVQDAFVDGAEASLPEPAATLRYGTVIKAVRDLNQIVVGDTGETYGGDMSVNIPPIVTHCVFICEGSPVGSGSLLSSRIWVGAELGTVCVPGLSSSLVGRALYVSADGGSG